MLNFKLQDWPSFLDLELLLFLYSNKGPISKYSVNNGIITFPARIIPFPDLKIDFEIIGKS